MRPRSRVNPKRFKTPVDQPLLILTCILLAIGLLMVFSASSIMSEERYGSAYLFFARQFVWDIIGLFALWGASRMDYHKWAAWSTPLLITTVVCLLLVLVVGHRIKGARRWLDLGVMNFQPSELAKITIVIWLATYIDRHRSALRSFTRGLVPILAVVGFVCGLIVVEPDLGTPFLICVITAVILFLAGTPFRFLSGVGISALIPLYFFIWHVPYRRRRVLAFLNPGSDPHGAGYQVSQSLMAFGSGGFWGKGIGGSTLKQLSLPDAHTDFIFPIIGEELGFVGAFAVVMLFVLWGLRAWGFVKRAPDLFGQLLAAGITTWILIQAVMNMGVTCGIFPTKGLPLPFVSFGGSATVITLFAVGILLNISKQCQNTQKRI